jgi:hypothetical protein
VTISDKIIHSGDTNTAIRFPANDTVTVETSGSERLRVDSSGRVGIGTTSPQKLLDIRGSSSPEIRLQSTDGSNPAFYFGDETDGAKAGLIYENSDNALAFTGYDNSERMRITSAGEIVIGGTSSPQVGNLQGLLLSQRAGSVGFGAVRYTNNTSPPIIALGKSRGGSVGANAILQNNDSLGWIEFAGDDGVDLHSIGASIVAAVDGTPGADDMPGRLVFSTTADGSASPTERMRIGASGNVGIGGTANAAAILDVASATKGFLPPRMTTAQRDAISTPPAGLVIYNTSTNVLNFYNGSAWGAV